MEKQKLKGTLSPKVAKSQIPQYLTPMPLINVITKILVDSEDFMPTVADEKSGRLLIKASIPDRKTISIAHRGICVIDCGFSVNLAPGFKAIITSLEDLAVRGLMLLNSEIVEGRVKVTAINVGKEILVIEHNKVFGYLHIEQIYYPEITL